MADDTYAKRDYGPDEPSQPPKTGFDAFKGKPLAIIIGIALGVLAGLAFMFTGIYVLCCFFLGYLLVALALYYIPKIFGADKLYWQAIVAVLFLVCSTAFGAMYVSPDAINNNEYRDGVSSNGFNNLQITTNADNPDELIYTFEYDSGKGDCIGIQDQKVRYIHYTNVKASNSIDSYHGKEMGTVKEGTSYYEVHVPAQKDTMYHFQMVLFKAADNNNVEKNSKAYLYEYDLSQDHKNNIIWQGNFYQSLIVTIVYIVVCLLMFIMHRYLEKTRAKFEAEGRLYPQGYGRCKECGTMVLPGETCCRKCGAYVDIPDEMRVKKVDSFHCSECGAEVPGNALCCPRCGAKFDEDDEVVVVDKDGNESQTIDTENLAKESEEKPTDAPAEETVENKEEEKKE